MEAIKQHAETAVIILTIISSLLCSTIWLTSKFNNLEKDMAVIKAVLVMKNIMPAELAKKE
jgi:hypothetical protein